MKSLYEALGVYLPLITTNCAVLGVALTNVQKEYGIFTGMVNGFATALGFTISIVILAGIREKLEYNDYPESFKGMPMVLVTAGLMAIAFCGFPDCYRRRRMVSGILIAMAVVGAVGLFIGLFLGIAGIKFKVEVDEREEAVLSALPGNNCGGCGYAGCANLAAAIAKGEAPVNACPVGGEPVGKEIAKIMGVEAGKETKKVAFVACQGTCDKAKTDYEYHGIADCAMLSFVPNGGPKSCDYGCTGFGNCVKACPFDAIHVVDGVAVVDKEACKACGKCVAACPKHLISLVPYDAKYLVACSSKAKGPVTMKECSAGCIGCTLCQRNCPVGAAKVTDFLAKIDPETCKGCGICAEKCPKKVIVKH